MIVLNRIDNRLIHGQVIEAWLPFLKVRRLVVADDVTAHDDLAQAAMSLAVPPEIEVLVDEVSNVDWSKISSDKTPTLVLFRDVKDVSRAREFGLPDGVLNVGNVHAGQGRISVTRSVFLNVGETQALHDMKNLGMQVVIQAVPNEKPSALPA